IDCWFTTGLSSIAIGFSADKIDSDREFDLPDVGKEEKNASGNSDNYRCRKSGDKVNEVL
ncbi:LOW QUALITY PROTEIN: hypothetical protein TorRG33x02_069930, partial [Trema orientale]